MAKLNIAVSHRQPKAEALARIKNLLGEVKREHGDQISDLEEHWTGDSGTFSFKVRGMSIDGVLTVKDREVVLDGTIPFAAALFKGKITEIVTKRANALLA